MTEELINILGLAHVLGDSLGAQYEFRYNQSRIYQRGFHYEPCIISRFQGKKQAVMGQWTDDTEMALCLLQHLRQDRGKYDADKAVVFYMAWANSHPFGMGKTTRQRFHGIRTVSGYHKRTERLQTDLDPSMNSQSNGSLMRAWPLIFFSFHEEALVEDCKLTNPNPINIECNLIYGAILRSLIEKSFDPHSILAMATHEVIRTAIMDAMLDRRREFLEKQDGWVVHGLYFAMVAAMLNLSILEIYDHIIQCRVDPDTTAAIAGAVIAAKHGCSFLEDPDICSLLQVIIQVDTTKGDIPRPNEYHPRCYYSLQINELSSEEKIEA